MKREKPPSKRPRIRSSLRIQLIVVMPIYRRTCKFSCLLHILLLLQFHFQIQHSYSSLRIFRSSGKQAHQAVSHNYQRVILGATYQKNVQLTIRLPSSLLVISSAIWLYIFLYFCGDVHPNPGPNSTTPSERLISDFYFTPSSSTTRHSQPKPSSSVHTLQRPKLTIEARQFTNRTVCIWSNCLYWDITERKI